ncbi:MAG: acyl-CoA carboxylase epsilon subunit [Mycetocola sp.]
MTAPESRRAARQTPSPASTGRFSTEGEPASGVDVHILSGSPTADEIAAVTAVLTAAVLEESARADAVPTSGPSAWQRSQRVMRPPLTAGAGRWRSFSG